MDVDLSKIKEVKTLCNGVDDYVSKKLSEGWVLLDLKIVEDQRWIKKQSGVEESHLRKSHDVVYVIGRLK